MTASSASPAPSAAKRVFDVVVASAALVLLAPVLAAVAVAIKLDSPGPVFFRQPRVGRGGVVFSIHKFRTMAHGAAGPALTVGDDPRVTRVGRVLRRTRLDELAQLIDVLQGPMSIVGPRPEVPRYVALYPPGLRERALAVKPGITDPVSLAHLDEGERLARAADPEREYVEVLLPAKLAAAVAYAERATIRSDLGVIAATLKRLVVGLAGRRGAG